jgi:hypothetical protein
VFPAPKTSDLVATYRMSVSFEATIIDAFTYPGGFASRFAVFDGSEISHCHKLQRKRSGRGGVNKSGSSGELKRRQLSDHGETRKCQKVRRAATAMTGPSPASVPTRAALMAAPPWP